MSLRNRLVAAAVSVLALLAVVSVVIVVRQRSILTDQIDEQLTTVTAAIGQGPRVTEVGLVVPDSRNAGQLPTGDFYFAVIDETGVVTPLVHPVSHPNFAPVTDGLVERAVTVDPDSTDLIAPFTVDSVSGPGQARTVVVDIGGGLNVVVARSTDRIDEAQTQLAMTTGLAGLAIAALLGLVLWWVDRLGLQPIHRLTTAAEEVAAGRSDRRVEHPPTTTETGRLGVAFNTMLDARQRAEDRQRRFVADASHELRTPLTTLRGYADLHASGGLTTDAAVADAMNRIGGEADRMAALVEDLLVLASLDEGRPLDLEWFDLSKLLTDIGCDAGAVQPDRRIDTGGVEPSVKIQADRHLLTKALTAATTNVLRHTGVEAGLTITATVKPTTATAGVPRSERVGASTTPTVNGDDVVVIQIIDRGPGIAAGHLPMLFDRFYRADAARSVGKGGRGLGLSIARTAVQSHGGSIGAASATGRGTTITINLPLEAAPGGGTYR